MMVFTNVIQRILRSPANVIMLLIAPLALVLLAAASNTAISTEDPTVNFTISVGTVAIVDGDNSTLSKALVNSIAESYNIIETSPDRYRKLLTDQYADYAVVIGEGFERDMIAGKQPAIEGYMLTVSEFPYLVEASVESLLQSYRVLAQGNGENLTQSIIDWQSTDRIEAEYHATAQKESNLGFALWMGIYAMMLMWTALSAARPMIYDMEKHIYLRIGAAPISPWRYQLQMTLGLFLLCSVQAIAFSAAVAAITGVTAELFVKTLLAVLSYTLFCVGFAVMASSLARSIAAIMSIGSPVITILAMLGGLFWPVEYMPVTMQRMALFTPTYWFAHSLETDSATGFALCLAFVLAFAAVCLLFGSWKKLQPVRY